jgi:hypothetical protein
MGPTPAMVRMAIPGCQIESRTAAGAQRELGNSAIGQLGNWEEWKR